MENRLHRPRTSLIVLAGGRASRMGGVRKATLRVRGRPIIQRILDSLAPLVDEMLLLVHAADDLPPLGGTRLVVDQRAFAGPLDAVADGLQQASGDVCLLVAADMPFVSRDVFDYLIGLLTKESASVVVPYVDGHIESMHAVFVRQTLLEAIRSAQKSGEQRLFKVFESLQARLVPESEIRTVDPDLRTLFNVNTPEELGQAERLAGTLSRGWKVRDFAPGEGLAAGAQAEHHAEDDWLPIGVPGDVHRALIDSGRVPDPFYADNETACAWMEQREWWYRVHFEAPHANLHQQLTFHGLDTFATIYLNGAQIGEHHNMFRPAVFDVELVAGSNVLAVRFDPPLERINGKTLSRWGRNPERTAMRKAQFGYGWDWGPRLPTIGIWRPVELTPLDRAALLRGVHFYTLEVSHERAAVAVRIEVERLGPELPPSLSARVRLESPSGDTVVDADLAVSTDAAVGYYAVEAPRLWWTHDLGEPALYDLTVSLDNGEHVRQKVGIRTLSLDQSPDPAERGTRFFRFVLNGVPIFAKGADWIPADSFVGALEPERYTRLLEQARDANMTMIRIWGGGIYEHDQLYAECDRLGLLVWQDFMFACAMYPEDDPDFVREVDLEARYQVQRLRSHPCLALWCGNNENQWLHERYNWNQVELPAYGALYYDEVLPRAVAEVDGRTPYWPGTPFGGNDHNSREQGNVHNWEVWHGNFPRHFGEEPKRENTPAAVSYRRYAEDTGRFISEFGMHAAPVAETLWRVIPEDQRFLHSPLLDWHNKDTPKNKGDNLLLATTGLPTDIDQYILFSQIAQAEGLKFGIEHYRRRTPHCSGTLVWQLNDCWPVLSWSVLDYYGVPKASFHFLARVYAPLLASFKPGDDGVVELWLTNDGRALVTDEVHVTLGRFAGGVDWEASREVSVAAGASLCVWRLTEVHGSPAHYLHVESLSGALPANRHFFADIKDLERQPTAPRMTVHADGPHALSVDLEAPSDAYVYFAHLVSRFSSTRFSDNYIDVRPGQTRSVRVTDPDQALSVQTLRLGWA